MTVKRLPALPVEVLTPYRRLHCEPSRTRHLAEKVSQRLRILKVATWIAAGICVVFGMLELVADPFRWWFGALNLVAAAGFIVIPWLYKYGDFVAPLTFTGTAYVFMFAVY